MQIKFNSGLGWYITGNGGEILASQFDSKEECEQMLNEMRGIK